MIIGKFQTKEDGRIVGELHALLFGRINLTFTPKEKGANYTVTFSETGIEAGAAWNKTSKEGGKPFISVRLDSPVLSKPFNTAMFPGRDRPGTYVLVWDRREPEAETTA
jgi:uncharacterized protein (DUF736 family)